MRKTLIAYYLPNEEELKQLWETGLFIVDANVLLNLYRYSEVTSKDFLRVFGLISDRLWISHQAAKEYQTNRRTVITQQQAAYQEIRKSLKKAQDVIEEQLRQFKRHPVINSDDLQARFDHLFSDVMSQIDENEKKHPSFWEQDWLWDTVTKLFEDKVGSPYSKDRLEKIYQEGEKRYKSKLPPGYSDSNKDSIEKYGDLIVWFQILDKAQEIQRPIIFITDDRKEDWWYKFQGKAVGPRPELIEEIRTLVQHPFYMYQPDQFLKYANEYFGQNIKSEVIEEVKEVRTSDAIIDSDSRTIDEDLSDIISYFITKDKNLVMEYDLTSSLTNIAGMCKFAIGKDNLMHIDRVAKRLGLSKKAVRLNLLWLEARGRLKIEKWLNSDIAFILPGEGLDDKERAQEIQNNLTEELLMLKTAYKIWQEADHDMLTKIWREADRARSA